MVARKQYYAIKNALTPTEKLIINFYELQWNLRHRVPTVEEIVQYVNTKYEKENKHHRIKHTSVNFYLNRKMVTDALDNRGIPWRQHSQDELTPIQIAAGNLIMNFADERSIPDKLDSLGVNPTQYYAWLNDPQFKNYVDNMAEQNKVNIRPTAIAEFTKKINAGDWNAIKFWMEATGEFTNNSGPNTEVMLRMIIEVIQDEIKDPETIMRIAQRIKLAAANRTLEVVSGEVATITNVGEARKKLGV